ncbi:hypothetical protein DPMN_045402 [Dreissena polymorpha]|uniref:Uncharacterized protein n=1 Tax=Dreissena polymorpha TaxID=45954 RepID=A0A9D4HZL8_DREPO|nr:hypothetical protein DPMN_045402 [Dreissena polymorpha]
MDNLLPRTPRRLMQGRLFHYFRGRSLYVCGCGGVNVIDDNIVTAATAYDVGEYNNDNYDDNDDDGGGGGDDDDDDDNDDDDDEGNDNEDNDDDVDDVDDDDVIIKKALANSVDPDETPHDAASHLGLCCLRKGISGVMKREANVLA